MTRFVWLVNDFDTMLQWRCMKPLLIFLALPLVILGLVAWGRTVTPTEMTFVEGTNVACLNNGHQNLALHIHPTLTITVDGENEPVPGNIGITNNCMAEVHTHDPSGTLHVETVTQERFEQLSFHDFFAVSGYDVEREGYDLEVKYNGEIVPSVDDVPIEDLGAIELVYTTKEGVL